jgi:hypothetical protein
MLRAAVSLARAIAQAVAGKGFDGEAATVSRAEPKTRIWVPIPDEKTPRLVEVRYAGTKPAFRPVRRQGMGRVLSVLLPDRCAVWVITRGESPSAAVYVVANGEWDEAVAAAGAERTPTAGVSEPQPAADEACVEPGSNSPVADERPDPQAELLDAARGLIAEVRGWVGVSDLAKDGILEYLAHAANDDQLAARCIEMGLSREYRCLAALKQVRAE